ncbi:MAG: hypothetical protein VX944_03970 [Myxococcota bacterium]|nr:hypothetical protein [Myxococcota bacterium]
MALIRTSHLIALFLTALVVRLLWVPRWSLLQFEGHEAAYLRAFQGSEVGASTASYPALTALYGVLGSVTSDPRALVVFSALIGALGVVGFAIWVSRGTSSRAGVLAGTMACLLPEHVLWSTSAYNVIVPNTLLIWALALRGYPAFVLCLMAGSVRVETLLVAPFTGIRGALGSACGVGLAIHSGITFPQIDAGTLAFDINLPMVRFLGPSVLVLSLLGLRRGGVGFFAVLAVWVHITGAAFEDYGGRHALLGGLCLVAMVANARLWIWPVATVVVLGLETMDAAARWHAPDDGTVKAEAMGLPPLPSDCVEVTEEPTLADQPLPSHIQFFRGEIDSGCVVWGEEFWHRSWSSRGLMDRATRMRTLYTLEPVAARIAHDGRPARLYHRLARRW